MKLEKIDYQKAIHSQSACNVSGLVKSLAEVLDRIWEEAREQKKGTDFVNQHPITRLYAEQISFLSQSRDWIEAYKICEEKGGE